MNGSLYIAVQMIPIGLFLGFKPHCLDIYGRGACGICPEAVLDNERLVLKATRVITMYMIVQLLDHLYWVVFAFYIVFVGAIKKWLKI